jgi:hypothetical protein
MHDAVGIVDLIDGRWPLGAQPAAARRMQRIPLELADFPRLLVDVGEQAASRFAVEASGGNELIVLFGALRRPTAGFDFHPIVPHLRRRRGREQPVGIHVAVWSGLADQPEADGGAFDPAYLVGHNGPRV